MKLVKIKSIKKIGRKKAYNITMTNNHNFLLGNGVLTHNTNSAQDSLKNLMEKYSDNCKFILTANDYNKIIEPLKSRCSEFKFNNPNKEDIKGRLRFICDKKELEISDASLNLLINKFYPDIRKCINVLQKLSFKSSKISIDDIAKEKNFVEKLLEELVKQDKFTKVREWILNQNINYNDVLRELNNYIYNNSIEIKKKFNSISKIFYAIVECNRYLNSRGWQEIEFENMIKNIMKEVKKND